MNLYRTLNDLSTPGIWAIVNERDRLVYLSQSNNVLASMSRNIDMIHNKSHSCRKLLRDKSLLSFVVLEEVSSTETDRKLRLNYWINHYRNKGYTLYRKHNGEATYTPKLFVTKDYKVHVTLVNKRNDKLVVGVFDKMNDATQFITTYYSNIFYTITYSDNILTKEYYNRKKAVV
jgi:hypothetical protein